MKAGEVIFQDLLNGKLQYRVPLFQRTYSWDEDQWERLWDDILEVYAMPNPQRHFIGAVVTQPIPDAPERAAKFLLIDGQQRMTTLLLMLSVIRFHASLNSEDASLASEITDTCLTNVHVTDPEERFKLRPTLRDREPFRQALQGKAPDTNSQIGKAWAYFSGMIEAGDHAGEPIELRQLKERATYYLDLVSIKLETGDSPNRIFESLNNTGVRLEASDLIRNFIFMLISDEEQQNWAYEQIWFPMQEELGVSIDDFFWRYSMKDGALTRWDDIFDDTKAALDKLPKEEIISSLEAYSMFSKYYLRIKKPQQRETNHEVADQLNRLNEWEVDVCYPFLLALFDAQAKGQVLTAEVVGVLKMIESFIVRRTVCGVPTNRLRRIFAGMVAQCREDDIVHACHTYLQGNGWPEDDEFHDKMVSYRLYNRARLARTRLVLHSLESSFEHKEAPNLYDNITVEHIMPQDLSDPWITMLGSEANRVHSQWLDSIGNLTLTGYNSTLGNKPFAEKKEILEGIRDPFKETNVQLTKHSNDGILQFDAWNEESIRVRADRLVKRSLRIWSR